VYDNVNFKDTKHNKVISYKVSMRAMTTAAIIYYPKLLLLGL